MKTAIIRLEKHDDVLSTRDKLAWSHAQRALLVWPGRKRVLTSRLDLTLIQRQASALGIQLGIVTKEQEISSQAQRLGIPVFASVKSARKTYWRKPRASRSELLKRVAKSRTELQAQQPPDFRHQPMKIWTRLAIFAAGILAVSVMVFLFLPKAEVILQPASREQRMPLALWARKDLPQPYLSGGLPATELTVIVEGQTEASVSGSALIASSPATGTVQLTNLTSSIVDVPSSTIISGQNTSQRFETVRAVRLQPAPAEPVFVGVRALVAGRSGNLRANLLDRIEGNLGFSVSVAQPQPFRGGSEQTSRGPSDADYARLESQLIEELTSTAKRELEDLAGPFEWVVPNTITVKTVLNERQDPAVGMQGDRARLVLRVEFAGWVVSMQHIEAIASVGFSSSQPPDMDAVPGSFQFVISQPVEFDGDEAHWQINASRRLMGRWSRGDLAQVLAGQQAQDASSVLSKTIPLAAEPKILIAPAFWRRLPYLPFRIEVRLP